jgi:diaminopropionate ammonia-lyase
MKITKNPFRNSDISTPEFSGIPFPASDPRPALDLVARCPKAAATPLRRSDGLAAALGVSEVHVKDERGRMGLGSFKALGAAYVIACDAAAGSAAGRTYVTASAGNHGLSVAAGASAFGARARIYIAETVPEGFAERLRSFGAEVRREGKVYEQSMAAAARDAAAEGLDLLSDSSWPGYVERPHRLMEGYLILMAEVVAGMTQPPTHVFLQAGVGGLAAAAAAHARVAWGDAPQIIVVEPEVAPALADSIRAGRPVVTKGPVSAMGRLDCKEPSLIALRGLARDADLFMTITEAEGAEGARVAAAHDLASTASGAAGLAGALAGGAELGFGPTSRVLLILSEEAQA